MGSYSDERAPSMSHMQAPTGATRDGGKSDDERPSQITTRQEKEAMSLRVSRMISLEVLGWCWAAFLAVFAIAMLLFVVVDELNYDYEAER